MEVDHGHKDERDQLWDELRNAVTSGNASSVERVLAEKAARGERFDLSRLDSEGLTLMHQAVFAARLPLLRLLHKSGGDVSVRDEEGCTLLHTAAMVGNRVIAAYLIKEGANLAAHDGDGFLPLDRADDSAMEEMLVQAMARAGHVGLALPSEPAMTWQSLKNVDRDSDYGTSSSIGSLSDEERASHTFDSADDSEFDREADAASLASPAAEHSHRHLGSSSDVDESLVDDDAEHADAAKLVRVKVVEIDSPPAQSIARRDFGQGVEDARSLSSSDRVDRTTVEILWSKMQLREPHVERTIVEQSPTSPPPPLPECASVDGPSADDQEPESHKSDSDSPASETDQQQPEVTFSKHFSGVRSLSPGEREAIPELQAATRSSGESVTLSSGGELFERESNSSEDTLLALDHSDPELSVSEPDTSSPPVYNESHASSESEKSPDDIPFLLEKSVVSMEPVQRPEVQEVTVTSVTPPSQASTAAQSQWAQSLAKTHSVIATRRKELLETGQQLKTWSEQHSNWMAQAERLEKELAASDEVFDPCEREQPVARKTLTRSQQFDRPVSGLSRCHTLSEVDLGWVSPHASRPRVTVRRKPLKSLLRRTSTEEGDTPVTSRPRKSVSFPVEVLLADAIHAGDVEEVRRYILGGIMRGKVLLDNGLTPLHLAVLDRQRSIVKLLLSNGVKVDQRDADGWTPLHAAASEGTVPVTHLLLENGADPWAKTERDGKTAYQLASNDNVRLVLSKAMGETSKQVLDPQSNTNSEISSGEDEEEEVWSDDEGDDDCDDGTQSDMDGADNDSMDSISLDEAPMSSALVAEMPTELQQDSPLVNAILARMHDESDETRETHRAPPSSDVTSLHPAMDFNRQRSVSQCYYSSRDFGDIQSQSKGKAAGSDDDAGDSLFDLIAGGDLERVLRVLEADKSRLDSRDSKGWTLLHAAAAADSVAVAKYLLSAGSQACVLDDLGMFPLQLSRSKGMQSLLESAMLAAPARKHLSQTALTDTWP